ncbi:putative uncharacterized transposon-derived protein F52C9.6 [Stylophora pistillata]|uniref:Uncharacterized transposon-derived protein F52C9.6 n=1 Tax=Stylophora pistillata TaxID=50429 RepID=A0A2B4S9S0_STYPI|nr:putative uncharacterized transposon-derived protein F52C9.6 [Stylophora pistillata]
MVRVFYDDFKCAVAHGETLVGGGENGIRWKFTSKLDDLDFADDIVLLSSTKQQIQDKTTRLDEEARRVGLQINKEKTKAMRINAKNKEKIIIKGQGIEDVDEFVYLGGQSLYRGWWYEGLV